MSFNSGSVAQPFENIISKFRLSDTGDMAGVWNNFHRPIRPHCLQGLHVHSSNRVMIADNHFHGELDGFYFGLSYGECSETARASLRSAFGILALGETPPKLLQP